MGENKVEMLWHNLPILIIVVVHGIVTMGVDKFTKVYGV
jgi:hypothetical protein